MIIDLIKYIFLGMIQGFTEPIPVSSSGHLLIFQKLIGSTNIDYQTLSIITNFGSLIAIVIIFWNDIKELFIGFFGYLSKKEKAALLLKAAGYKYSEISEIINTKESSVDIALKKFKKEKIKKVK